MANSHRQEQLLWQKLIQRSNDDQIIGNTRLLDGTESAFREKKRRTNRSRKDCSFSGCNIQDDDNSGDNNEPIVVKICADYDRILEKAHYPEVADILFFIYAIYKYIYILYYYIYIYIILYCIIYNYW